MRKFIKIIFKAWSVVKLIKETIEVLELAEQYLADKRLTTDEVSILKLRIENLIVKWQNI